MDSGSWSKADQEVRPKRLGRLALLALLVLAAVVVVACGGGQQPAPQSQAGPSAQPAGQQADAAPPKSALTEPIMFAGLDWDSAALFEHIARFILEKGYGYKTDSVPGSTIPMLQGLIRGDIQVYMEVPVRTIDDTWFKAKEQGSVIDLGYSYPDAVQGFFVPTYVIEGDPARGIEPMAPDLKRVTDLPKYWELFRDPEDPSKGRFYDCIAGWACEKIDATKWESYGLGDTYNRFLPGTGAALDASLVGAYKQGKPWVGFYWTPTWIAGKYDLTLLEEDPYTDECWDTHKMCHYPLAPGVIAVHKDFYAAAPDVVEFLKQFEMDAAMISVELAWMDDNQKEVQDAAVHFLQTRQDVWVPWVPAAIADKVKAAL